MKHKLKMEFSTVRYPPTGTVPNGATVEDYDYVCAYHNREVENHVLEALKRRSAADGWVFVVGCASCQNRYDDERFGVLDRIKYNYEIAVGYLGRWLTILDTKSHRADTEVIQLAKDFLLEMVVSERVFLEQMAAVTEGLEYQAWVAGQQTPFWISIAHMLLRGAHDWEWQYLRKDCQSCWGDVQQAKAIISEMQERLADQTFEASIAAERKRFLSRDVAFEEARTDLISRLFGSDTIGRRRGDIEERLVAWDKGGRGTGFDVWAVRRLSDTSEWADWAVRSECTKAFEKMYCIFYEEWEVCNKIVFK